MKARLIATLLCTLPALPLCIPAARGESPYQQPSARVVRNTDGTRLNVKVDPHNQRVEEVLEDAGKTVLWRIVKELDDALLPLRATKYDGRNNVISQHRYLYLRGRLEEEEVLDEKSNLLAKLVFFYDSKGRNTRIDQLNAQGVVVSSSRATGPGVSSPSSPNPTAGKRPSR